MEEQAITPSTQIALDQETLSKLTTYEDFLSYYVQLDETSTTVSWVKADLLLYMSQHLGEKSLEELGKDMKQPLSTVINYVRTSRAYPPNTRNPALSFSHHFQASFSDTYDDKTKTFLTKNRFDWIERASEQNLSTRLLKSQIHEAKDKEESQEPLIPCAHCGKSDQLVIQYVFYAPGSHERAKRIYLDEKCRLKILSFIYGDHPKKQ